MSIGVREGGAGGLQPPQFFENLSIRAKIILSFGQRRSGDWTNILIHNDKAEQKYCANKINFYILIMHCKSEMQCLCIFMNTIDRIAGSNMLRKVKF